MVAESKKFEIGELVKCNPEHPQIIADRSDNGWSDAYHAFLKGTPGAVVQRTDDGAYDIKMPGFPTYCCVANADMLVEFDPRLATLKEVLGLKNPVIKSSKSALDKQVSGNHYKDCGIQPIEYIHANNLNYFEGNAVKYITRHRKKNGKADIEKAIHYLELMLELEYKDETI